MEWIKRLFAHQKVFDRAVKQSMLVNIGYGVFHIAAGLLLRSNWMASNGGYYLVNGVIMGLLLGYERRIAGMDDDDRRLRIGWRVYELCGGHP